MQNEESYTDLTKFKQTWFVGLYVFPGLESGLKYVQPKSHIFNDHFFLSFLFKIVAQTQSQWTCVQSVTKLVMMLQKLSSRLEQN